MTIADTLDTDIHTYLKRHENKQLLRFVTVGSVDDGKSTLIGRLLYDTKGVYDDQLADARTGPDGAVDLARITDGLQAEREQGITIDVAYRYFTTKTRKFIIADTPGHVQYTRNMATGASTANVAIILIDARLGVLPQSRRHAYIASLLGIPNLVVAVNKMDLKGFAQEVFDAIVREFSEFARALAFREVRFFPVSALEGDNCVVPSARTPWYGAGTILDYLESVQIDSDRNFTDFRFPVQYVIRPNLDYRGFAGQVASGSVRVGDRVRVLPSGRESNVTAIDVYDGSVDEAFTPQSVTIRLADEVDVSRGDVLVFPDSLPTVARDFEATVVWMHEQPLDPGKTYLVKHTTRYVPVSVRSVAWRMDLERLEHVPADGLELNDIGGLELVAHRPLVYDPYAQNRSMGAFILIDTLTNATVAAGMISARGAERGAETGLGGVGSGVSARERHARLKQKGCSVWFVGRPASGKSTLAFAVERRLFDLGYLPIVLDADDHGDEALFEHERKLSPVELGQSAARATTSGLIALCAFGTSTREDRSACVRAASAKGAPAVEIYVDVAEDMARVRDARGAYAAAMPEFQPPGDPARTVGDDTAAAVEEVVAELRARGVLS